MFFQVLIWAFQPDANSKHGSHRWSKMLSLLLNSWPKPRSKVSSRKWVVSWLSKFESYKNLKFSGHISLVHVALGSKLLPVASSFGKHSTGKVTKFFRNADFCSYEISSVSNTEMKLVLTKKVNNHLLQKKLDKWTFIYTVRTMYLHGFCLFCLWNWVKFYIS